MRWTKDPALKWTINPRLMQYYTEICASEHRPTEHDGGRSRTLDIVLGYFDESLDAYWVLAETSQGFLVRPSEGTQSSLGCATQVRLDRGEAISIGEPSCWYFSSYKCAAWLTCVRRAQVSPYCHVRNPCKRVIVLATEN